MSGYFPEMLFSRKRAKKFVVQWGGLFAFLCVGCVMSERAGASDLQKNWLVPGVAERQKGEFRIGILAGGGILYLSDNMSGGVGAGLEGEYALSDYFSCQIAGVLSPMRRLEPWAVEGTVVYALPQVHSFLRATTAVTGFVIGDVYAVYCGYLYSVSVRVGKDRVFGDIDLPIFSGVNEYSRNEGGFVAGEIVSTMKYLEVGVTAIVHQSHWVRVGMLSYLPTLTYGFVAKGVFFAVGGGLIGGGGAAAIAVHFRLGYFGKSPSEKQ